MKNLADNLSLIAITLWVGGLWAIGYIAAPVLFAALSDKMLAGMLAGRMFTVIAYVGIACGTYLVLYRPARFGAVAFKQGMFWASVGMLLLTVIGHFGIQPILEALKAQALPRDVMQTVLKNRFAAWHGISSGLYLLQSLLGLVLVLKQKSGR
jgi:predicted cobalt transporter CbtA